MIRRACVALILSTIVLLRPSAWARQDAHADGGALEIFFIDVEGGQSTLVVTPARESLLIDAGYAGRGERDLNRVLDATRAARIDRIDHLLITHFHPDHVGGVAALAARIPIGSYIDYGSPLGTPLGVDMMAARSFPPYENVRDASHHVQPKPGDRLPIAGIDATIVSAAGEVLAAPLPGAVEDNPLCAQAADDPSDGTENYRSIGVRIRYGAFTFLDVGDLSGDTLLKLVCPHNRLAPASVYLIAHHGNYDTSVPAVYGAVRPRVVIMNNGPSKGGDPMAFRVARQSPGLEALWQLHLSRFPDAANSELDFVANIDDGSDGHWLKLSASTDGSFAIVNERTGATKTYARKQGLVD